MVEDERGKGGGEKERKKRGEKEEGLRSRPIGGSTRARTTIPHPAPFAIFSFLDLNIDASSASHRIAHVQVACTQEQIERQKSTLFERNKKKHQSIVLLAIARSLFLLFHLRHHLLHLLSAQHR